MRIPLLLTILIFSAIGGVSQVPIATGIQILKAEDARRYDSVLERLIASPNADIRIRAMLAAGRIGDDKCLPALTAHLESDPLEKARVMAAFAIGEVESVNGADSIIKALADTKTPASVRARAVEAAGKIAAANAKNDSFKILGAAILMTLKAESGSASDRDRAVVLLALTAALRARPEGADIEVARYLSNTDARIRADAGNTLTRLRAKNANEKLREIFLNDNDDNVRVNAVRALGAAEDKAAFILLIEAATNDKNPAVRISAIRSLGSLKDVRAAGRLLDLGNALSEYDQAAKAENRTYKNEALEIATVIGRLLTNTENAAAIKFLTELNRWGGYRDPETQTAFARVAPKAFLAAEMPTGLVYRDFHVASAYGQGLAEIAATKNPSLNAQAGEKLTRFIAGMATGVRPADQAMMLKAMPELMRSLAALKPDNLDEILRGQAANEDLFIRTAAVELIADQPKSKENIEAVVKAFTYSLLRDKHDNDAMLAILGALNKLDKKELVSAALMALNSQDYLVRKRAFELLADKELQKEHPGIPTSLEIERSKHKDQVHPYSYSFGTKLGQVLNIDIDYRRALARKNGSVKAVLTTAKGVFTIDFTPEDAPLTVDNFVKLARANYFNGLEVHRVVPNFVMQDGDPRGDGNGGPGWSIRCEVNMLPYDRGAVGMALSGKDTGGSQWFVTHSPQPHLDGGYTVFGHVNETDMKVVDSIVRGDKIINVRIVERNLAQRTPRKIVKI